MTITTFTTYRCPIKGCEAGARVPTRNGFPLAAPGRCARHGEEFTPEIPADEAEAAEARALGVVRAVKAGGTIASLSPYAADRHAHPEVYRRADRLRDDLSIAARGGRIAETYHGDDYTARTIYRFHSGAAVEVVRDIRGSFPAVVVRRLA